MSLALHYRWEMHISAQGPCVLNDLYCVEWDVKLFYTIPYHTLTCRFGHRRKFGCCRSNDTGRHRGGGPEHIRSVGVLPLLRAVVHKFRPAYQIRPATDCQVAKKVQQESLNYEKNMAHIIQSKAAALATSWLQTSKQFCVFRQQVSK